MAKFIVFCSTCTISSLKRFTVAISSADELLVTHRIRINQMFKAWILAGTIIPQCVRSSISEVWEQSDDHRKFYLQVIFCTQNTLKIQYILYSTGKGVY